MMAIRLKLEKFCKEQLWQHLLIIATIALFAWLFDNMINNMNVMPTRTPELAKEIKEGYVPSNWKGAKRQNVTKSDRRDMMQKLLNEWIAFEKVNLALYERKYKELVSLNFIAYAQKVSTLIEAERKEIKDAERLLLDYQSVDFDMGYIQVKQHEMHEFYEKKTEEVLHIRLC